MEDVWTSLPDPLAAPINRPPGIPPGEESSAFITAHRMIDIFAFSPVFGIKQPSAI
jgi:hypothetical protein